MAGEGGRALDTVENLLGNEAIARGAWEAGVRAAWTPFAAPARFRALNAEGFDAGLALGAAAAPA